MEDSKLLTLLYEIRFHIGGTIADRAYATDKLEEAIIIEKAAQQVRAADALPCGHPLGNLVKLAGSIHCGLCGKDVRR